MVEKLYIRKDEIGELYEKGLELATSKKGNKKAAISIAKKLEKYGNFCEAGEIYTLVGDTIGTMRMLNKLREQISKRK